MSNFIVERFLSKLVIANGCPKDQDKLKLCKIFAHDDETGQARPGKNGKVVKCFQKITSPPKQKAAVISKSMYLILASTLICAMLTSR